MYSGKTGCSSSSSGCCGAVGGADLVVVNLDFCLAKGRGREMRTTITLGLFVDVCSGKEKMDIPLDISDPHPENVPHPLHH